MIEGICPKCSRQYWGWALAQPRYQSCAKCGAGLIIYEDGRRIIDGYSPFTAERYQLKTSSELISNGESEQEAHLEDKSIIE
jgi:ssDNA-binding Zn-finger/Zn-ribbon topoisomerase 1